MADFTFISTSGGGTDANNTRIRAVNTMTWAGVRTVTGKPILADTGYGAAGQSAGHDAQWDIVSNINARITDGVISITQYNPRLELGEHHLADPFPAGLGRLSLVIARVGLLALALVGGTSCRSGGSREDGSAAPGGRLVSPSALHDFGAVVEGDTLRHAFAVTNTGNAPVRIARVERSPACRATATPSAPVAAGGTTAIEIECDSRNRPPKLVDAILVFPDDGGPPLRLELRATIEPLLAFEPGLAVLETPPINRRREPFASSGRPRGEPGRGYWTWGGAGAGGPRATGR